MKKSLFIVFVLVFSFGIHSQDCMSSTSCNIVPNGGFENGVNCGAINMLPANCPNQLRPEIFCWSALSGSPDYFVRGCVDAICSMYSITVPAPENMPAADTWNPGSTINDKMLGLVSINYLPSTLNEAMQVSLYNPLEPNVSYRLKFVARVIHNNNDSLSGILEFGGSINHLSEINYFYNSLPDDLIPLSQIAIPNNNAWNTFEIPIVNSSSSPLNFLTIINAEYLNTNPEWSQTYILIDDVSIVESATPPQSGSLNLVDVVCLDDTIPDLAPHVSDAPAGGTFEGPGVEFDGENYSFSANIAGEGNHLISYTYAINGGCTHTLETAIRVSDCAALHEMDNESDIFIYPNPAGDYLSIASGDLTWTEIKIVDVTGKTIRSMTPELMVIPVSDLSPGIYFIELISESSRYMREFVK